MVSIIRNCKAGSDWTINELDAYNIAVVPQNELEFFPQPISTVDLSDLPSRILDSYSFRDVARDDKTAYQFMRYLDLATHPREGEESAVDDFAAEILRLLDYDDNGRVIRTRKSIDMLMCGQETYAKTDVCIVSEDSILLLLQEDKSHISRKDPEPQLVAEAIAAFQYNNKTRVKELQLSPVSEYIFPCITLIGTVPTFYKIKVTIDLSNAVRYGIFPHEQTIIYKFDPLFGEKRKSFGMTDISNRNKILKCYKLFKKYVYNST
ncbi:hypothetical protein CONCODRAFT_44302 [Conidiobolus coronatus NRRL 28638]|uniref:Uncharacterized protein n=1 Tax=Conidiobolus coronatus (strain ATCC 28846 / CBS 209.66 / NRRL 28638) TaxID=796925 RepID=A0A137NSK3_CONC2|nr:hypothetical protein CONCODRAFT_44302 [Conidiobolus coronatus NRRL 28638]|eukprot:KXN65745.1 hypothetical protein CONCODRAFT_44302 [Conidiobolus coronatus NRRL 28638]